MRVATLGRHVVQGRSLAQAAGRYGGITAQAVGAHVRGALQAFVSRRRVLRVPPGPLVLLIDGVWVQFRGRPWVVYLMAVKPVAANQAIFLDPVVLPGREDVRRWADALATLPPTVTARICALIADDLRGFVALAAARGWVLQLCHFHLLSRLQARRGRRKRSLPDRQAREQLYQLTRRVITLPDGRRLRAACAALQALTAQVTTPARMRMTARECLRRLGHYRAYALHPHLHLPATTGSVEAMARIIRALLHRTRNLSSPHALRIWVTALIRIRPTVMCNGRSHQPNFFV